MRAIAIVPLFFSVSVCLAPVTPASATLVLMEDRDSIVYDETMEPVPTGEFSDQDPTLSYGFGLDPGEVLYVTITAPEGVNFFSGVTSEVDFGGNGLILPNSEGIIYGGTSYTYHLDGKFSVGKVKWVNMMVGQTGLDVINAEHGGSLPISGYSYTSQTLPGDDGVPAVPLPASLWLLASGFAALAAVRRRQRG